jgi:hypothetical protein
MKWLEIIILRTAGGVDEPMNLWKQIITFAPIPGLTEALVYTHFSLPGDLAITLNWETDRIPPWGSELALGLVKELRRFGLVDHSIWMDRQGAICKEETMLKGKADHLAGNQREGTNGRKDAGGGLDHLQGYGAKDRG